MTSIDCFKVYSRGRPLNEKEITYGNSKQTIKMIDQFTMMVGQVQSKQTVFQFDGIFDETKNNLYIFQDAVIPLVQNFVNGYNSTVFAYGITGAGKSFTMFGNNLQDENRELGLIPLTFEYLFSRQTQEETNIKYKMSYIQIYNEQVYDLLSTSSKSLQIIEDPSLGVYVNDLEEKPISSIIQASKLIEEGNSRRVIAETKANEFSSRSHAIVLIAMERKIDQKILTGKLSLVDLAGSERQTAYSEGKGIRNIEGSNINRSLLTLGNCINILSEKKKNSFVPYRDSKLTRLLKDSLGGNTKTIMIACISPSHLCYDQTLNTLKYACRAKKIQKVVYQNIKQSRAMEEYKNQISKLRKENDNLKKQLQNSNNKSTCKDNKQKEKKIRSLIGLIIQGTRNIAEKQLSSNQSLQSNFYIIEQQQNQSALINQLINECLNTGNSQSQQINQSLDNPYQIQKLSPRKRPKSTIKVKEDRYLQFLNLQGLRARVKQDKRKLNNMISASVEGRLSVEVIKKNVSQIAMHELFSNQERPGSDGIQRGIFNEIKSNVFQDHLDRKIVKSGNSSCRHLMLLEKVRKIKDKAKANQNIQNVTYQRQISQENSMEYF